MLDFKEFPVEPILTNIVVFVHIVLQSGAFWGPTGKTICKEAKSLRPGLFLFEHKQQTTFGRKQIASDGDSKSEMDKLQAFEAS